MMFNVPGHIEMIRKGTKTQTRRAKRGYYQVESERKKPHKIGYAVQQKRGVKAETGIRIVMDRIWEELPLKWKEYIESGDVVPELGIRYIPISKADAQAEGGYSVEEYEKVFRQINPKWAEDVRYAFEFHCVEVRK